MSPSSRIPTLLIRRPPRLITVSNRSPTLTRLTQRSTIRSVFTASQTITAPAPDRPSRLRRLLAFSLRALFFTTLGFTLSMAPFISQLSEADLASKTDADTLEMWEPSDDAERAHEEYLSAHPLVRALRADPALSESRPNLKIPGPWRAHNLTAGALMGPGRVPFPPVAWLDAEGPARAYVQVSFAGEELCGHPGIVHGGYLATVLDEGLARVAFAALPNHVGVTANLNINYKAPCKAGQYIVLRGELTKAEGRKAWVEGRLETLPAGDEEPVVLATATALYIEPKQAASLSKYYTAT